MESSLLLKENAPPDIEKERNLYIDFKIKLPSNPSKSNPAWPTHLKGTLLTLHQPGHYSFPDYLTPPILKLEQRLLSKFIELGVFSKDSKYYQKFRNNVAKLTKLSIPIDQSEDLMFCHGLLIGWVIVHDDVLDNPLHFSQTLHEKGAQAVLESNELFCSILSGKYPRNSKLPDCSNFPLLQPLASLLQYFLYLCKDLIPNFGSISKYFIRSMIAFINSSSMIHSNEKIDSRFSEESARYWLRLESGFKPWLEFLWLIRGIQIPKEIRRDPLFKRLMIAAEDCNRCTNDVLGVAKDLENSEQDNLVIFKFVHKKIPLIEAFQQTVDFANEQASDIKLLIRILQQKYSREMINNKEGFLRVLQDVRDGYIYWLSISPRYAFQTSFCYREAISTF